VDEPFAGGCGIATAADIVLAAGIRAVRLPGKSRSDSFPAMVMAILRRSVSEKRALELLRDRRDHFLPDRASKSA